jgi:hypothetical protein
MSAQTTSGSSSLGEGPLPSIWELVLLHCPENEVEEVKRVLGFSLVEQAADLHCEVCMLIGTTDLEHAFSVLHIPGLIPDTLLRICKPPDNWCLRQ